MNETHSGADAQNLEELDDEEFHKILNCSIEELLEKAWREQWKIVHIEFWLKVKNAQNAEKQLEFLEDLCYHIDHIDEDTKNINANLADLAEKL